MKPFFKNHNVEGSVNDPVVMKKFYDEFNSFSYHLTGDFLLKPITLEFLKHSRENDFKLIEEGKMEITFRLPPRGDAMEELKILVDESLNLQRFERVYRFRDQSKTQDTWIISKE